MSSQETVIFQASTQTWRKGQVRFMGPLLRPSKAMGEMEKRSALDIYWCKWRWAELSGIGRLHGPVWRLCEVHSLRDQAHWQEANPLWAASYLRPRKKPCLSLVAGEKREKESEGGLLRHKREFSGLPLALHSVSSVAVTADQSRHSVRKS